MLPGNTTFIACMGMCWKWDMRKYVKLLSLIVKLFPLSMLHLYELDI